MHSSTSSADARHALPSAPRLMLANQHNGERNNAPSAARGWMPQDTPAACILDHKPLLPDGKFSEMARDESTHASQCVVCRRSMCVFVLPRLMPRTA
jgi:hypothetical protein